MFVAVCTTPKASPSPTRPHKTWSFLGSPDCTTPPPEELLEKYYNETPPTCDPFSDHHLSDEPLYEEPYPEYPSAEEPYLSRSHLQGPPSTTTCPYPEDPFALLNNRPPVSSAFSPLSTPSPPPSVEAPFPDRIAIINLNNNNNDQSLHLANHLSAHFPTLLYTPSPSSHHHHHAAGHPLLTTTSNPALLSRADYLILPASAYTTAPLRRAVAVIAAHVRPGATVIVESSGSALPVGTTRALLGGLHARRGMLGGVVVRGAKAGAEAAVAAGLCHASLAAVVGLYGRVCPAVLAVAGVEVAERVGGARGGGGRGFHGW